MGAFAVHVWARGWKTLPGTPLVRPEAGRAVAARALFPGRHRVALVPPTWWVGGTSGVISF